MKTKSFDEFSRDLEEKKIIESIYQEWKDNLKIDIGEFSNMLNEEYDLEYELDEEFGDDDEREYTSGERAAITKDEQVLTDAQLAALYLRAKEIVDVSDGKYTNAISGIEDFVDKSDGKFVLSAAALADAIGLRSARTAQRTIGKFKNLITGEGATPGESLSPKIKNAFKDLEEMSINQIVIIASEAMQDPSVTIARDTDKTLKADAINKSLKRKEENIKIGEKVYSLVNSYKRHFKPERAHKEAFKKLENELNLDKKRLIVAYNVYLKNMKLPEYKG